uniref:Uncharacterized protein n=1 Tax=Wuchereria bancrofti TaxID=6293 RepID=A0AAF5PI54_WUCBA
MITVKNIYGLPTERHERGIYKVVYDEDERPVLDKQLICKPNKELTTALEPISRQAEEFEELMSVEAFEKKGEKNGINFDIVMQLETGEGKEKDIKLRQIKVECSNDEVEQVEKIPNEGIRSIKSEKTEVSRTPHGCQWDTKSAVIIRKELDKLEECPALHTKWSEMEKSVQEQIEFTGKRSGMEISEQYGMIENYSEDNKIDATRKSMISWKLTNSMEKKDGTNQYFYLDRPSENQMWPKEGKGSASGTEESNFDDKYLLTAYCPFNATETAISLIPIGVENEEIRKTLERRVEL